MDGDCDIRVANVKPYAFQMMGTFTGMSKRNGPNGRASSVRITGFDFCWVTGKGAGRWLTERALRIGIARARIGRLAACPQDEFSGRDAFARLAVASTGRLGGRRRGARQCR